MFELTYDTRHKPFLTQTTFKIIGLFLLGISQLTLAFYAFSFTTALPVEEIPDSDNAADIFELLMNVLAGELSGETSLVSTYKILISIWPNVKDFYALGKVVPIFLLIGLFSTLVQERKSIFRIIIKYFIFTILFYLAEIIGYYFFLFPLIDALGESYLIDKTTLVIAEAGVYSLLGIFGNFNIFIDLFVCSLFFFFVVYVPKKGFFRKHFKLFRSLTVIPVLYLIASVIFTYLAKTKIQIPLTILALFSSRGIYAHLFFWIITLYYKYRRVIYKNNPNNQDLEFKQYLKTGSSKLDFALVMGLAMLVICLFEKIFADLTSQHVFNFSYVSLGRGIHLYCFVFLLLFFDFTKKPRFKFLKILYVIYYVILALVLFGVYAVVIDYAMAVLKIISNAIGSYA